MLITLIVAVAAGAATRPLQPHITEALVRVLGESNLPEAGGRKVFGFAVLMIAAAAALWLLGVPARPVAMLAGGLVGYFQEEIREAIVSRRG